jgi:chromosome segregation ATPase
MKIKKLTKKKNDNNFNDIEKLKAEIESLKKENNTLIEEINKLKENEILLNGELDDYEKEAKDSEKEINMVRYENQVLISELEKLKKSYDIVDNKNITDDNRIIFFTNIIENAIYKTIIKNKFRFFLNMLIMDSKYLLIEINKLNNERNELNERVLVLTDLINNPENMDKFIEENENINEQDNENHEEIEYENYNNNYEEVEDADIGDLEGDIDNEEKENNK